MIADRLQLVIAISGALSNRVPESNSERGFPIAALQGFSNRVMFQRTPWGGGKKRGVENLTNDTPPKKGFWTPARTVRFPPPSGVSALFFLYKNPRQSRPEALLEGSKNFRESAFSGTFSSPHTFCTPPYHGPNVLRRGSYLIAPKSPDSLRLRRQWFPLPEAPGCAISCDEKLLANSN